MLAPQAYKADLESSVLRRVIGHRPSDPNSPNVRIKNLSLFLVSIDFQDKSLRSKTATLWKKCYPDEPFHMDLNQEDIQNFRTAFSYNIVRASGRQQVFFYQVRHTCI